MRRTGLSIALLLAACSWTYRASSTWHTHTMIGLSDSSGAESFAVECPDVAETVRFSLDIRATKGAVRVRLVDAAGACRCDDMVTADRELCLEMPAMPGTWRCQIDYAAFGGDCSIELRADGSTTTVGL